MAASLKTDYQDDVITGNRKYTLTTEGAYTVLTDETDYVQEGDIINASVINGINQNIMSSYATVTLAASSWTVSKQYTITDARIKVDTDTGRETQQIISIARSATAEQRQAWYDLGGIYLVSQADGSMTFACMEDRPAIDIPVEIRYMGWK